jgi:hypothetical protein
LEDTLNVWFGQPQPQIPHRNHHVSVGSRCADHQFSRSLGDSAHRLYRVHDQIKDDLLEFNLVPFDVRQPVREFHLDQNVVLYRFRARKFDDLSDCVNDVQSIRPMCVF